MQTTRFVLLQRCQLLFFFFLYDYDLIFFFSQLFLAAILLSMKARRGVGSRGGLITIIIILISDAGTDSRGHNAASINAPIIHSPSHLSIIIIIAWNFQIYGISSAPAINCNRVWSHLNLITYYLIKLASKQSSENLFINSLGNFNQMSSHFNSIQLNQIQNSKIYWIWCNCSRIKSNQNLKNNQNLVIMEFQSNVISFKLNYIKFNQVGI